MVREHNHAHYSDSQELAEAPLRRSPSGMSGVLGASQPSPEFIRLASRSSSGGRLPFHITVCRARSTAASSDASRTQSTINEKETPPPRFNCLLRQLDYLPDITHEVLMGNMQKIKSCVERFGLDVNQCGHDGLTPMHVAASQGNLDVCRYLVKNGGDIFAKSNDGMTPLHMAARAGHLDVVKLFKDSEGFYVGDIDIKTYDLWSSLHFACRDGRAEVFHFLVHETNRTEAIMDVDLDARTGDGRTPLLIAAEAGHERMVDELIQMGCNSEAKCSRHGHERMGALHLAALMGHEGIVRCLTLMGEDLDVATQGGWTPLMLAAHAGKARVVKTLVNGGADVLAKTKDGANTAMDLARRLGHEEIVGVLQKELEMLGG